MKNSESPRTRRPLWQRLLGYTALTGLALLGLAVAIEAYQRAQDEERFPMPGVLVDIGSHRMHWWCEGAGAPLVVLDAGAVAFSTSWRALLPEVSKSQRVCAFDRSGLGWSEPGPGPWDANQAADELAMLLDAVNHTEPFIYVGHSLGAMLGRVFAERYPQRLAGLLLLEPADPDIIIAEFNEERQTPLTDQLPASDCSWRCKITPWVAATGLPRWFLNSQEILKDPKLPELAVNEFVSRSMRGDNIAFLARMGRYFPRIFFQTKANQDLSDIPLIFGYGTRSGELLGDHDSEEERISDNLLQLAAWKRTGELSSQFLGMREVEGANHLSLVTYPEHARAVAEMVGELTQAATQQAYPRPSQVAAVRDFLGAGGFGERHPRAPENLEAFGQLAGIWQAEQEMLGQDGQWHPGAPALWVWRYDLDGYVVRDLWLHTAEQLPDYLAKMNGPYMLTSLRTYDSATEQWQVAWAANGGDASPGADFGTFQAVAQDNQVVMQADSEMGKQRVIFSEISRDHFAWRSEYSADGENWIAIMRVKARRRR